jgi:predicted AlkP superfamily phosphohydrolase/phosphomutase/tetratricopeptide (TPR) repeat protein
MQDDPKIQENSPEQSYQIPVEGALGLLAIGHRGLRAWRQVRDNLPEAEYPQENQSGQLKNLLPKILLIGWDAADWKVINPLLDAGEMPALERLINNGVMGNIATLNPPLSPMLWTSIATGKTADQHGILGFIEPDPDKGGARPVNSTSRKVKAIWNILHQSGMKSNIIGWWPSHPAEPINGVMISNFYSKATGSIEDKRELSSGIVYPPELSGVFKELLVHPEELTAAHLLPFVPLAAKIDQTKDPRLNHIAKIIAEAATMQSATTWLMENTEWNLTAVYFDSIDHFCHGFMKYHPPKLKGMADEDFEMYKDVVASGYKFHDMMLERLMELAGKDTTIILLSDHGFFTGDKRAFHFPDVPAAPALEHNPYGIICMSGKGIKKDERIYGATLLDITPTLLSLMNLPVAHDMAGKILLNAFEENIKVSFIDSWETMPGECGMHPEHLLQDPTDSMDALNQLVELGYIEKPDDNKIKASETAVNENRYNLSKVLAGKRNFSEALAIVELLFEKNKLDIRYGLDLVKYYLETGQTAKASEMISHLRSIDNKSLPSINLLEALLCFQKKQPFKALQFLKKASTDSPANINILIETGRIYLELYRFNDAAQIFSDILKKDEENASAWHGLGISMLRLKRYDEAAESLLNAIGLLYHFPSSHYHLGECFYRMYEFDHAIHAFKVCLAMNPRNIRASSWISRINRERHLASEESVNLKNQTDIKMKGEIIIVSGLPRSGTSLMMQMLKAGGIDLLTDEMRLADINNPKGYFEYQPVKNLARETNWLDLANRKAVKVIVHLLKFLPPDYNYKIILLERKMTEIMASQQKMLGKDPAVYPMGIAQTFKKELEKANIWADKEPHVQMLKISYNELLQKPEPAVEQIINFLGQNLDKVKMIENIDMQLYRNNNS